MNGYIEWRNEERNEAERADITNVVAEQGKYNIVFANTNLWSEGRLELTWGDGTQVVEGHYGYTDASYEGKAKVMGHITKTPRVLEFTGTWHDPEDGTGQWDVYIYIEDVPGQEFTFKYDDPDANN